MSEPARTIVGCMTGTSIDAIDVALVRIDGRAMDVQATPLRTRSAELGPLARDLRAVAGGAHLGASAMARLALRIGELHAEAIEPLLCDGAPPVDLVVAHGQTVYHKPPLTLQLINPAPIAHRLGVRVLTDLRQADLCAGGQGAPITPVADWVMFREVPGRWCVVNLGGFCNITLMETPGGGVEELVGADVCACNQLLDAVTREMVRLPFDDGGALADAGWVQEDARDALLDLLRAQRDARRSLGTGDEMLDWIIDNNALSCEDMCATACDALAIVIREATRGADPIVLAGGGTANIALVRSIEERARGRSVLVSDALGVPARSREAIAMAIIGALCEDRQPVTFPWTTGARAPVAGAGTWTLP